MTLTERISMLLNRAIKEEKKFTQVELARKMNISPVSVNKWMKDGAPSLDKLPQLCEILEITPNELFGYDDGTLSKEALALYKAFQKHPEYQNSVMKLLEMIISDFSQHTP